MHNRQVLGGSGERDVQEAQAVADRDRHFLHDGRRLDDDDGVELEALGHRGCHECHPMAEPGLFGVAEVESGAAQGGGHRIMKCGGHDHGHRVPERGQGRSLTGGGGSHLGRRHEAGFAPPRADGLGGAETRSD